MEGRGGGGEGRGEGGGGEGWANSSPCTCTSCKTGTEHRQWWCGRGCTHGLHPSGPVLPVPRQFGWCCSPSTEQPRPSVSRSEGTGVQADRHRIGEDSHTRTYWTAIACQACTNVHTHARTFTDLFHEFLPFCRVHHPACYLVLFVVLPRNGQTETTRLEGKRAWKGQEWEGDRRGGEGRGE